jgi:hypothetical protein
MLFTASSNSRFPASLNDRRRILKRAASLGARQGYDQPDRLAIPRFFVLTSKKIGKEIFSSVSKTYEAILRFL